MDLSQANKSVNQSEVALIDWNTPPMVKNSTYDEDCIINNPFDMMESEASTMDPFNLVFYETPIKKELQCSNNILSPLWELKSSSKKKSQCGDILSPLWEVKYNSKKKSQCGDILSPLWEFKSRSLRKSISLTDINGVAKILDHTKVDKFNNDYTPLVCLDQEVVDQSKENCVIVPSEDKKVLNKNEDQKINEENEVDTVLTIDHNSEIDMGKDLDNLEKNALCSEDEKKKIREQTRQRIQMLIEKGIKDYEEECSRKSLFCTPIRNSNSSLNKSESLFNRGFLQSGSHIYDDSSSKINECKASKNDSYKSSLSSMFHDSELNSFDLNSLKPEWITDNFSDSDSSGNVQIKDQSKTTEPTCNNNNDINFKLKALNRIGIIESKPNACNVLKSMHNKKPQNKGPFLANVPLEKMMQNYEKEDTKEITHAPTSPRSQIKPMASSTPTTDMVACKTPSTSESSIKSRPSISRRSISSVDSLSTPLNATKTHYGNENKLSQTNVSHSANKRSNTTIVLYGESNERKLKMAEISERLQSFKLNKSQSLSKIGKIPKPMTSSTNRMSGLPVPKRFSNSVSIPLKGKENIKPQ